MKLCNLQRGFPVAIALKKKTKPQPKVTKAIAVNKEAGRRSEVPFSRREEGRELGEKRKRKKEKRKRKKEKEGNETKKEKRLN